MKGFKVLEASYEESQKALAVTKERLSVVEAAHAALIANTEVGRQVPHDRNLEASYEESQKTLTVTKERLSVVEAAHAALIANMEVGRQVLRDRETVR